MSESPSKGDFAFPLGFWFAFIFSQKSSILDGKLSHCQTFFPSFFPDTLASHRQLTEGHSCLPVLCPLPQTTHSEPRSAGGFPDPGGPGGCPLLAYGLLELGMPGLMGLPPVLWLSLGEFCFFMNQVSGKHSFSSIVSSLARLLACHPQKPPQRIGWHLVTTSHCAKSQADWCHQAFG